MSFVFSFACVARPSPMYFPSGWPNVYSAVLTHRQSPTPASSPSGFSASAALSGGHGHGDIGTEANATSTAALVGIALAKDSMWLATATAASLYLWSYKVSGEGWWRGEVKPSESRVGAHAVVHWRFVWAFSQFAIASAACWGGGANELL